MRKLWMFGCLAALLCACGAGDQQLGGTDNVTVRPPEPAEAGPMGPTFADEDMESTARHVTRAMLEGDAGYLQTLHQAPLTINVEHSAGEGPRVDRTVLATRQDVAEYINKMSPHFACPDRPNSAPEDDCIWYNGLYVHDVVTCDQTCCAFPYDMLNHNGLYLDRVCFDVADDGTVSLSHIDITDGD